MVSDQVTLLQGYVANYSEWALSNLQLRVWVSGEDGNARPSPADLARTRLEPGESTSWDYSAPPRYTWDYNWDWDYPTACMQGPQPPDHPPPHKVEQAAEGALAGGMPEVVGSSRA